MQPDKSATRPRFSPVAGNTLPVKSPAGAGSRPGVNRSIAAIRFKPSARNTGANGLPSQPPTAASRAVAALEAELERAEKQLREDRDHRFMTEHPDGIGPTLGQDLGAPNLGSAAVDWNHEDYDPPT
jgi:hypothetical protein